MRSMERWEHDEVASFAREILPALSGQPAPLQQRFPYHTLLLFFEITRCLTPAVTIKKAHLSSSALK